jgi:hypothetical protein
MIVFVLVTHTLSTKQPEMSHILIISLWKHEVFVALYVPIETFNTL